MRYIFGNAIDWMEERERERGLDFDALHRRQGFFWIGKFSLVSLLLIVQLEKGL
jgi:hypothetical protein